MGNLRKWRILSGLAMLMAIGAVMASPVSEQTLAAQEVSAINAALYGKAIHPALIHQQAIAHSATSTSLFHRHQHIQAPSLFWRDLAQHFTLNDAVDRPDIRHQLIWFLSHRGALNEMLNNSVPYLYYVFQQTQKRDMPAEFALLPMIESSYDPFAYSKAGATGLWQMMPGTASSFGLDIDWWYDGRRDTIVSTQSALNYLCTLHDIFHRWTLAAAAYDAGIGAVQGAQSYNQQWKISTDFWNLPLPNETREYVPKLLALAAIIKNPQYYGVHLPHIPDHPYFFAVNMNSQIDLVEASRLAHVSTQAIRQLNPGMLRWASNPNGVYTLLVPYSAAKTFEKNLSAATGKEHVSWEYHEVRSGETLASIASNYHMGVSFLAEVNRLPTNTLMPGQGLVVPLYLHRTFSGPIMALPQAKTVSIAANPQKANDLKQLLDKIYSQPSSE